MLLRAVLEETPWPPKTGPVGRSMQAVQHLCFKPRHSSWIWQIKGQAEELDLMWVRGADG